QILEVAIASADPPPRPECVRPPFRGRIRLSCPLPLLWPPGAGSVMGSCKRSSRGKGSFVTRSNLANRGLRGASASRKACPSCQAGVVGRRAAKAGPRRAIGNRLCCGTLPS
ncbi:unnamed protein product, partial [Staurois parvus]